MVTKIYELKTLPDDVKKRIITRCQTEIRDLIDKVQPIVKDVRSRGDDALIEYTYKFEAIKLKKTDLEIKRKDIDEAYKQIDRRLVKAIEQAVTNIRNFHQEQLPRKLWFTEVVKGVHVGLNAIPLDRVGCYVPAGKGRFPSVVPMLTLPAKIAGVREVILCTPPIDKTGDPATLVAADMTGVDRIFRVGGAIAIAAMAYGTESIPKVLKIVGPGGGFVSAAKLAVQGDVALGTPAGPSEILVLADDAADPMIVAAESLAEAEHGPDSSSVIIVNSRKMAEKVLGRLNDLVKRLPYWRREFAQKTFEKSGAIIIAEDMDEAVNFINDYAPEHLVILDSQPFETMQRIRTAGAIFLGGYSSVTAGCYLTGSNNVLPTGGTGRYCSTTTVFDFLRFQSVEYLNERGLESLSDAIHVYTTYEGFPAHSLAVKVRKEREKLKR
ncbi:histidinol dehydrogenase [[Eubacterium] cellulosolvens]